MKLQIVITSKRILKFVVPLCVVIFLSFFTGCVGEGYQGSGKFDELTRTYIPVVGVTKGYIVEMPRFSTAEDYHVTNSLAGLPRQNDCFCVELAIYIPKTHLSRDEVRLLDISVPSIHEIHCVLFDAKSKRVFKDCTKIVSELGPSQAEHYHSSPFVKNIFTVPFAEVPKRADLRLFVEYKTGGQPLKREMMVIIINDAPIA
jgi:hypothetical protein